MNKICSFILLLSVIAFSSCEKCATCTREWKYNTYKEYASGTTNNHSSSTGPTETFDVCDNDAIKNAEKPITSRLEVPEGTAKWITTGTATTSCVTQ